MSVINAGGVETDGFDSSVLRQPARRIRVQTGKMKLWDRGSATLVGAEVSFSVRIEFSESSTQLHDSSYRYLPMPLFPILKVAFGDEIIRILLALLRYIDYDPWSYELFERNLIC